LLMITAFVSFLFFFVLMCAERVSQLDSTWNIVNNYIT